MNGRLGIVGGLSILGTTGIVVPYSCSAWIHSIHRGIDVARAAGLTHIAGATGADLRSRGAEAARPAGDGADRHGRFRRRHAEISAHASGAARHHRRRRRQDDQARPGPARPAFARAARSISACWPVLPSRAAARSRSASASSGSNTAAEASVSCRGRRRGAWRCSGARRLGHRGESRRRRTYRDRDRGVRPGRPAGRPRAVRARLTPHLLGSGADSRRRRARCRGTPPPPSARPTRISAVRSIGSASSLAAMIGERAAHDPLVRPARPATTATGQSSP